MRPERQRQTADGAVLAPAAMVLAVMAVHARPILRGISFHDPSAFHYDLLANFPSLTMMARTFWQTGHVPLWISNLHMGVPFLAMFVPSFFHPLVLPFLGLPLEHAVPWLSLVNSLAMSGFGYLLFRRCGASPWGSAAAGALLALTGFFPWLTTIYQVALPLPWLLCWIWSAMGLTQQTTWRRLVWNEIALVMLLLGGDPHTLVEGAYLVVAWYLLWAWRSRVPPRRVLRTMAVLVGVGVAALILSMIQVLPTIHLFHRLVGADRLSAGEYAATFPHAGDIVWAGLGLFSRQYANLFLTVSIPLLLTLAWLRRRGDPAWQTSLILAAAVGVVMVGGRSGLATIPYHLPMLKGFIRHYKIAAILEGPLFLGVALGFDVLIEELRARARIVTAAAAAGLALTLLAIRDPLFVLLVLAAGTGVAYGLRRRWPARTLAPLLFGVLALDAGSFLWPTPYSLAVPPPDSAYLEYVRKLGANGRVQGMYPWFAFLGRTNEQPLPPHGHGLNGESSLDTWFEYPLRNHAYFLYAISHQTAAIRDGMAVRSNFALTFKSSDFITPQNHPLLNLAALRYFFLMDMALAEADRFPILSDPRLFAAGKRPADVFAPWKRDMVTVERPGLSKGLRPVLSAEGFGAFNYDHRMAAGDELETEVAWAGAPSGAGFVIGRVAGGRPRLLFARYVAGGEKGGHSIARAVGDVTDTASGLGFALAPLAPGTPAPSVRWMDPQIRNAGRPLKYRAGETVMVFENPSAFGRARVVHQARRVGGFQAAVGLMSDPARYDPARETVLMSNDAPVLSGPVPGPGETAQLLEDHHDEVRLRARLDTDGYLVLADTGYPGWRAWDENGREMRIYPVDISLRAVVLPAGEHTITYRYLPIDFRVGLFLFLASGLALVVLSLFLRVNQQQCR